MRNLIVLAIVGPWMVSVAHADSAVDAVPLAGDELARTLDERTIRIDGTAKTSILKFAADFDQVPPEIASISMLLKADANVIPLKSLGLFLSRADVQAIAAKLITHDDAIVRCLANVVLTRSGDSQAASRLYLLIHDESLLSIDKRIIRTLCDGVGIQAATDSAERISTHMTRWLAFPPKLKIGDRAPEFSARTVDGRLISSSQLRDKVIVLHFWATTCHKFTDQMQSSLKALAHHKDKRLEVIFVCLDNEIGACRKAMSKFAIPFENVCDELAWDGELAREFGINSLPFDIVIGRDGKVVSNSLDDIEAALASGSTP